MIIALKQYRLYHSNDTTLLAWLQVSHSKDCDKFLKKNQRPEWMKAILLVSKSDSVEDSKNILASKMMFLEKGEISGVDFAGSDTCKRPNEFKDIVRYLREQIT